MGPVRLGKRTPSHCSKKTRIIKMHINTEKGPTYLGLSGVQGRRRAMCSGKARRAKDKCVRASEKPFIPVRNTPDTEMLGGMRKYRTQKGIEPVPLTQCLPLPHFPAHSARATGTVAGGGRGVYTEGEVSPQPCSFSVPCKTRQV